MEPLGIGAARSFTVRPHLPGPLGGLRVLSQNLRWSHDRETQALFAELAPELWGSGVRDPAVLLAGADQEHLGALADDDAYTTRLRATVQDLESSTRTGDRTDGSRAAPGSADRTQGLVAYFSPEFGITEAIGQYSGGLGVLAGDHVKAAGELGMDLVAVGLFYRHGYFHQVLSPDGWQSERYVDNDPHTLPLTEEATRVELDLGGRDVVLRVWKAMLGPAPIYLLDADLPENEPDLRAITDRLYGGDVEHRLRQEILLGVGGVRFLRASGAPVEVFHTNEGHAGFMGLERIRSLVAHDGLDFDTAVALVRSSSVFTTHTPVPAGMERFGRPLMERYFAAWCEDCGVGMDALMDLGHAPGERPDNPFNMAVMGMRLSLFRNGVSAAHGATSRAMFGGLWPGVPTSEVPIGHITNGVHPQSWLSPSMSALLERATRSGDAGGPWPVGVDWDACGSIPDHELASAADTDREHLVEVARRRLRSAGIDAGRSPSELSWTDRALDPGVTTICFARRMAAHKRAGLLLEQPDRLRALLADEDRPVQFVFAGKAHTGDEDGKELVRRLVAFASEPEVRQRFVFLADYDIAIARALVQGADVWLNTPLHPLEASGTSGMKAALNGALNLSVLDGWWAEAFDHGSGPDGVPNGWAIAVPGADTSPSGPSERSRLDSDTLFELIEHQVLPLATAGDGGAEARTPGRSSGWWDRVRHSLVTLGPLVDAHRMSDAYRRNMYLPAVQLGRRLAADGAAPATELAAFLDRAARDWPSVRVESVAVDEQVGDLGSTRRVVASVDHGLVPHDELEVQLLVGHLGPGGQLEDVGTTTMSPCPSDGDDPPTATRCDYEGLAVLSMPGRMGLTVRVVPRHENLTTPAEPGLIAWADRPGDPQPA